MNCQVKLAAQWHNTPDRQPIHSKFCIQGEPLYWTKSKLLPHFGRGPCNAPAPSFPHPTHSNKMNHKNNECHFCCQRISLFAVSVRLLSSDKVKENKTRYYNDVICLSCFLFVSYYLLPTLFQTIQGTKNKERELWCHIIYWFKPFKAHFTVLLSNHFHTKFTKSCTFLHLFWIVCDDFDNLVYLPAFCIVCNENRQFEFE